MKIQKSEPVYAQCHTCSKKYDMVVWGVICPSCKPKKIKKISLR